MKKVNEIINQARRDLKLSASDRNFDVLESIWNAAVEECAKNATYCHVEGGIDRDSILSLKIEDDENN